MATIELGELGPGAPEGPTRPDTNRSARRRRNRLRAGLAALLVGVPALLVAGDPLPRPLPVLSVPARLGASVTAVGDWLLVADPLVPGAAGQELIAYRIPGTARADAELPPVWRTRLPNGDLVAPGVRDGVLLVATAPDGPGSGPARVWALDETDGTVRWARPGRLEAVSAAGDVLLGVPVGDRPPGSAEPAGSAGAADREPDGTLAALDPASGAVRWSLPGPPGAYRHYRFGTDGRARMMVVVLPSGRVETRDAATGALLRAVTLPAPGAGADSLWVGDVVADLFVTYRAGTVTAYGLPELDRRWSAALDEGEYGPTPCGSDLCSFYHDGGVRVWDPVTGRTRWADRRWVGLYRAGETLIGVGSVGAAPAGPLVVLDPDTGRPLAELGTWDVLPADQPAARFVGVRTGPDRRTWVAEIDAARRRVRLLAVLPDVSGGCGLAGRWLHCRRMDASIGLWPLPLRP